MPTVFDEYGPVSLGELALCEEMLNSHGLFAMKLYVELQEVRRGHPPGRCTFSPSISNRTCTFCELFDTDGLMTEVEDAIALYLRSKACLKDIREMLGGNQSSSGLRFNGTGKQSRSVAIESKFAKAALYSIVAVGDNLRNHHTKWQARLQATVLSTTSRLDPGPQGHKSKNTPQNRKKLGSDSKPRPPLQNLSTRSTSDGRRYILLEKCKRGCCPTLDDYAALSSSFASEINKNDTGTDTQPSGPGSSSATISKVINPPCSSQKLLITPEVLAAMALSSDLPLPMPTDPSIGSGSDSALPRSKAVHEMPSLASETPVTPSPSATLSRESDHEDEESIDDPRIRQLCEQLAVFDGIRHMLLEWCRVSAVDACTQIVDPGLPASSPNSSCIDDQPQPTNPDRTPRCADVQTMHENLGLDFEEDQEHLRELWRTARERQSKPHERTKVSVRWRKVPV